MSTRRKSCLLILCWSVACGVCQADPTVPEGFVIQRIMGQLDDQTPRLEAIRNSAYGTGIVVAGVDNGILNIYRIRNGFIETIATKSGYPSYSFVLSVRFDWTGSYGNDLFMSVAYDGYSRTDILRVNVMGNIDTEVSIGSLTDYLAFRLDFIGNESDLDSGICLLDVSGEQGTSFYIADNEFNLTKISQDFLPSGRTDLDITGMKYDPSERYGSKLTMTDHDANDDQKSIIYQLYYNGSQWVWSELNTVVHTDDRQYRDIAFSSNGSFGQQLYVTERYSELVQAVEPDGSDSVFASGFYQIESITVSDDGEHMYVSDGNGVWHIYKGDVVTIGPEFVMREPKNPTNGVFTNENGVSSVTLLFNEPITFDNDDVIITNEAGETVSLSVTGSGSQFMIIAFGETMLTDKYTITVKDTVVSVATGAPIDGDKDGQAGGDHIFTMEHRKRFDIDGNNMINLYDFVKMAQDWLWMDS